MLLSSHFNPNMSFNEFIAESTCQARNKKKDKQGSTLQFLHIKA